MGIKKLFKWVLPLYLLLLPLTLYPDASTSSINSQAIEEVGEKNNEIPVQARLLTDQKSIQPGTPFWVGIELKMGKGWDTYWINPGDSGFPTQVEWQLPAGFKVSSLHWPYPERFTNDALVAFGYADTVVLLAEITPPKDIIPEQSIEIKATVNWLACKEMCIPGNASLALSLPVGLHLPAVNPDVSSIFKKTKSSIPQRLEEREGKLSIQAQKESIILNFKPQAGIFGEIEDLLFIPETGAVVDYGAPQKIEQTKEGLALSVKRAPEGEIPSTVKGVLLVSEKGKGHKRAFQVDTQVNTAAAAQSVSFEGVSSLWMALGFAFLGGLILNVMPCVLPVIALKIFGFVKMAQQKRGIIFKHGAIFSGGVIVSFWVLSGALLLLRAYGEGIGWGFQLQEPVFVAILISILFLLGLSLFGVFEFGTSLISLGNKSTTSSTSPLTSSFMSGVLATLVATPCTGPLLGPALGFAMTLPIFSALAVFTSMGLGMASPYLLFSAFPKLVRFLPKPGNWMIAFKQIMGFLMMATVIWLVWVFGAETDHLATLILLVSLLVMAIGAWIFGKWGTPTQGRMTRLVALIVTAALIIGGEGASIFAAKKQNQITTTVVQNDTWEAFSPEKVESLRAAGKAVFIDFTAKWCLICQANKVTLHSAEIKKAFEAKGVVTLSADWTKKDAIITKELEKLGRTGVPVYVLYPADPHAAPYILPQTLTANIVQDYLSKL